MSTFIIVLTGVVTAHVFTSGVLYVCIMLLAKKQRILTKAQKERALYLENRIKELRDVLDKAKAAFEQSKSPKK